MNIILTESQYKKILLEEKTKNVIDKLESLSDFSKKLSSFSKKNLNMSLNFLENFSFSVGGFTEPLFSFMKSTYPNLKDSNLLLLSIGICLSYFTSDTTNLNKVLLEIKENSLIQEFDHMLEKASELKEEFLNFVNNLSIPTSKISNLMAYSFIIPLIPELYEYAQGNSKKEIKEMINKVVDFTKKNLSPNLILIILEKIVKTFQS